MRLKEAALFIRCLFSEGASDRALLRIRNKIIYVHFGDILITVNNYLNYLKILQASTDPGGSEKINYFHTSL